MNNNSVHVIGRVKRDARAVAVREGLSVLNFALVVEMEGEKPLYVDCAAYGDAAESLDGYVECGEVLSVDGWLSHRTYTGGDGRVRTSMVVMVEEATEVQA